MYRPIRSTCNSPMREMHAHITERLRISRAADIYPRSPRPYADSPLSRFRASAAQYLALPALRGVELYRYVQCMYKVNIIENGYMDFERNEHKAAVNVEKHVMSFEAAADALSDPYARVVPDGKHSNYEEELFPIGMDLESRMPTIRHCERRGGSAIRIISARRPSRTKERQYRRYRNE